jgi:hypothetical protein
MRWAGKFSRPTSLPYLAPSKKFTLWKKMAENSKTESFFLKWPQFFSFTHSLWIILEKNDEFFFWWVVTKQKYNIA